jgi:hypothetical protein
MFIFTQVIKTNISKEFNTGLDKFLSLSRIGRNSGEGLWKGGTTNTQRYLQVGILLFQQIELLKTTIEMVSFYKDISFTINA